MSVRHFGGVPPDHETPQPRLMIAHRHTSQGPCRLGAQDEQCFVPYMRAQIVSFGCTDTSPEIRRGPVIYSFEPYTGAVCKTFGFARSDLTTSPCEVCSLGRVRWRG